MNPWTASTLTPPEGTRETVLKQVILLFSLMCLSFLLSLWNGLLLLGHIGGPLLELYAAHASSEISRVKVTGTAGSSCHLLFFSNSQIILDSTPPKCEIQF